MGAGGETGGGRQMGRFYSGATSRREQTGRPYGDPQRSRSGGDGEYGRRTSWRDFETQPQPGPDPGLRERYDQPSERRGFGSLRDDANERRFDRGFPEPGRGDDRMQEEFQSRQRERERFAGGSQMQGGEQFGGGSHWQGGRGEREYGEQQHGEQRRRWQREPATASDIMTRDPKTVTPEASLFDVASLMKSEDTGIIPVVDESRALQGVVTDRDVVVRALGERRQPEGLTARDVMTTDVEAVTPDESMSEVIEIMGKSQVRRVPVVDRNDRLLGIISMADIANRADYDEDLQDALECISSRRSFWSRLWA